jgi:hypothetical protein
MIKLLMYFLLFVCVWVQTSGRRKALQTLCPASFLAGLMVGFLPLTVALSAIVLGCMAALAMSSYSAGLIVAGMGTVGIGYPFILGGPIGLIGGTLVVTCPLIINWMRRTVLVMPVRC